MKHIKSILFFIILAAFASACSPQLSGSGAVSAVDRDGGTVSLDAPASQIISLAPPLTEMLYAIGAGGRLVARDSFSDYPEAALALTDVGGGFAEYDLETIVSLDPDLVVAGDINTDELVQSLKDLGLTVFATTNPDDIEGAFELLRSLAALTGKNAEAEALIADLSARVADVDDALAGVSDRPTVYYELDATDPSAPYTGGPGSFYSAMIRRAGGENMGDALGQEWAQISLEALLAADPDYILLGDAMWGVTPAMVAERPGWDTLTAVREGRVLPFDDNLIARIGPRQVDGLEALAKILHPDLLNKIKLL